MEKQKILGKSNELVHVVYRFSDAIKQSFKNGHAKTFCGVLVRLLLPEKQDYFAREYSSGWAGFLLSRVYGIRFRSTDPSAKIHKTNLSRYFDRKYSSSSNTCGSSSAGKKDHYQQNIRYPDMVCTYLDGSPYMFWEFKSNGGEIYEAISRLVSFGLSFRDHKKTSYKIILVVITLLIIGHMLYYPLTVIH